MKNAQTRREAFWPDIFTFSTFLPLQKQKKIAVNQFSRMYGKIEQLKLFPSKSNYSKKMVCGGVFSWWFKLLQSQLIKLKEPHFSQTENQQNRFYCWRCNVYSMLYLLIWHPRIPLEGRPVVEILVFVTDPCPWLNHWLIHNSFGFLIWKLFMEKWQIFVIFICLIFEM